jgi:lipopolysaccharide biosynthesis protein
MNVRAIAMYLPQYHPIHENDMWWGKGFTDWKNVASASPRFKDHYQPHTPSDLGFYDLRSEEIRDKQASLAFEYNIYGFCYYHYWFNGKRLLNEPLDAILHSGKPDYPFCISWANEDWTRSWDGRSGEILMHQEYSEEDDIAHMQFLCRHFFRDDRYIKVNGKPLFIVYRAFNFPDPERTVKVWRETARKEGISELYLCATQSMGMKVDPNEIGFDAVLQFEPDFSSLPQRYYGKFHQRLMNKIGIRDNPFSSDRVYFYEDFVNKAMKKEKPSYKCFPGITPSWDNSSRRKKDAMILHDSTPGQYGKWLNHILNSYKPYSNDENFIFINAWNEWAEGNHLEPCQKWGKAYLEKTKEVLDKYTNS